MSQTFLEYIIVSLCIILLAFCTSIDLYSKEPVKVEIKYESIQTKLVHFETKSDAFIFIPESPPSFKEYWRSLKLPNIYPADDQLYSITVDRYNKFADIYDERLTNLRDSFWEFVLLNNADSEVSQNFNTHYVETLNQAIEEGAGSSSMFYEWHMSHVLRSFLWPQISVYYEFSKRRGGITDRSKKHMQLTALGEVLSNVGKRTTERAFQEFRVKGPFGLHNDYILSMRFDRDQSAHQVVIQEIKLAVSQPFDAMTLMDLENKLISEHPAFLVNRIGILHIEGDGRILGVAETEDLHKNCRRGVYYLSVMKMYEWTRWILMEQAALERTFFYAQPGGLPLEATRSSKPNTALPHLHELPKSSTQLAKYMVYLVSVPIERLFEWYAAVMVPNFKEAFIFFALHAYSPDELLKYIRAHSIRAPRLKKSLHARVWDDEKEEKELNAAQFPSGRSPGQQILPSGNGQSKSKLICHHTDQGGFALVQLEDEKTGSRKICCIELKQ